MTYAALSCLGDWALGFERERGLMLTLPVEQLANVSAIPWLTYISLLSIAV